MTELIAKLAAFLQPIGLSAILVILFGHFSRTSASHKLTELLMGTVFGLAAIAAMATPIEVSDGVILDLRNLFVGISAAFFGWRAGCITLVITAITRIYIGGEGAEIGVAAAAITTLMGMIWQRFINPRISNILISLPILAAMISLHLVTAFLLPLPIAAIIMRDVAPLAIVLHFAGTGLFSLLIYREIALVDESKRLLNEATVDPLTRVLNRRSVVEIYNDAVFGKSAEHGIAMACIDIDNFKKVNDDYGHLAGDQVLMCTARRIAACLRKHDLFCRMSGDEFLIIMTNVTHIEASSIAERCRASVSATSIKSDGQDITASISIGTAWARHAPDFNQFRNSSDEALYRAKSMGRDCSAFIVHPSERHSTDTAA